MLNIATVSENAFVLGTAVLFQSVLENTHSDGICFYVLDLNLKEVHKRRLEATVNRAGDRAKLRFLQPNASPAFVGLMKELERDGRRPFREKCWFSKFAIPDLLQADESHVLYIDSDVYCNLDLTHTAAQRGDCPLVAVKDGATEAHGGSRDFEKAGLDRSLPFFNAGFMWMDLAFWGQRNLSQRAVELLRRYGAGFIDQTIFNLLFYNNWKELPWDWNYQCPFGYGIFNDIAAGRAINLHYVTNPKPWEVPLNANNKPFYSALDRTAFQGSRPNRLYWTCHWMARTAKYRMSLLKANLLADRKPAT